PDGHTGSHARQPRQSSRCSTAESVSVMRPSASALIVKMRPRGESISVPSSENVGQYARQSPQCTHWFTPSTESPCSASGPVGPGGSVVCECAVAIKCFLDLDVPWPSNVFWTLMSHGHQMFPTKRPGFRMLRGSSSCLLRYLIRPA